MTLGGVFLEVFLSICYNRTGAFLVAGIYLIEYDREFVILLVSIQYTVSLTNKLYIYIYTHTHTQTKPHKEQRKILTRSLPFMYSHHPMRFNFPQDSSPKMPRAGNTSPATLHMRAQEHGVLRAK